MFYSLHMKPPWRNGLACWTSNSKVVGSSPTGGGFFEIFFFLKKKCSYDEEAVSYLKFLCEIYVSSTNHHPKRRTHCCGHIVADTNVSPFAPARNIYGGHKFCVRDTKNVFEFVQKHIVSATNVSQFAQPKKYHEHQCVRNKVSSFVSTFIITIYSKQSSKKHLYRKINSNKF